MSGQIPLFETSWHGSLRCVSVSGCPSVLITEMPLIKILRKGIKTRCNLSNAYRPATDPCRDSPVAIAFWKAFGEGGVMRKRKLNN